MFSPDHAFSTEGRGGQRGPENVWGSAATAAICALTAVLSPWDFAPFALGFTASLATKLSDTFASEIGKAYGKTTYLITTMQLVRKNTSASYPTKLSTQRCDGLPRPQTPHRNHKLSTLPNHDAASQSQSSSHPKLQTPQPRLRLSPYVAAYPLVSKHQHIPPRECTGPDTCALHFARDCLFIVDW